MLLEGGNDILSEPETRTFFFWPNLNYVIDLFLATWINKIV